MDIVQYRKYLEQYVTTALQDSDGTITGVSEYLEEIKTGGRFTRHKEEKRRALADAQKAFYEHRHWPMEIIISHLGLNPDIINQS